MDNADFRLRVGSVDSPPGGGGFDEETIYNRGFRPTVGSVGRGEGCNEETTHNRDVGEGYNPGSKGYVVDNCDIFLFLRDH